MVDRGKFAYRRPRFSPFRLEGFWLPERLVNSRFAVASVILAPTFSAGDRSRSDIFLDGIDRAALVHRFACRDMAGVNAALARLSGTPAGVRVDMVSNARAAEAAPVWRIDPDGVSRFRFHEKTWAQHPEEIFGRWLDMLPLIAAIQAATPTGSCVLNLGDEGHRPGLAFDGAGTGFTLIPDVFFIKTRGFADLARTYARRSLPWRERRPVVFWRGTTTGRETSLDALPRVRLCRAAQALGAGADVGFSSASQQFVGAESWLREQGLMREYVSNERYDAYQLHLSIDGNASPWGFLAKLHSGSPVLKVTSPTGYRQWYYSRLVPWKNYVPIRSDLADLHENVGLLLADPVLAQRIGSAGQRLAQSMSFEAEMIKTVPVARAAFQADMDIAAADHRHRLVRAMATLLNRKAT